MMRSVPSAGSADTSPSIGASASVAAGVASTLLAPAEGGFGGPGGLGGPADIGALATAGLAAGALAIGGVAAGGALGSGTGALATIGALAAAGAADLRPAGATPGGVDFGRGATGGPFERGALGGALLIGAGFGAAATGSGAAASAAFGLAASAAASRSSLISAALLTKAPSGKIGPFGGSAATGASPAGTSSALCVEANSSTRDSADILSTVLEALLTSNPRLRRSSMSSLFSIPTCLES